MKKHPSPAKVDNSKKRIQVDLSDSFIEKYKLSFEPIKDKNHEQQNKTP